MKRQPALQRRAAPSPRNGAGTDDPRKPKPGWKGAATVFCNARPPSVPTTLALTLEEYFAAGALMGLIASQHEEPDRAWACEWSLRMGRAMAAEALRRRRRARKR